MNVLQRHLPARSARRSGRRGQRGAAILLAVVIVALVTSIAAGMVWLQSRAVQVEAAERARAQAGWVLTGALDWARLILREDQRGAQATGAVDSLDEPWAQALEEARLSTFLAADKANTLDGGPEAFISGAITDAQARFNLRGLVDGAGKPVPVQLAALQALANAVGAPADTASRIGNAMASAGAAGGPAGGAAGGAAGVRDDNAPLRATRVSDLAWAGIDRATLARLAPFVELLPLPTPVNVNTAPREVLLAAITGLDLGSAERLVSRRARQPFRNIDEVRGLLGLTTPLDANRISVSSNWFLVTGRLRLEGRVLEERSLLQRDADRVHVRRRERVSFELGAAATAPPGPR